MKKSQKIFSLLKKLCKNGSKSKNTCKIDESKNQKAARGSKRFFDFSNCKKIREENGWHPALPRHISRPSPNPQKYRIPPSPSKSRNSASSVWSVQKLFSCNIQTTNKQKKSCSRERSPRRLTKICEITYKQYETHSCYFCFLHLSSEANLTSKP